MRHVIKEKTDVYAADGDRVGAVDRVVMDPLTRDLSHIVVRKGIFFPEDKVIPVTGIATATEDRINLVPALDPDALPPFEEQHYLPWKAEDEGGWDIDPSTVPLVYYGPYATLTPAFPSMARTVTERNIPERAIALQTGAPVMDRNNEEMGRFDQLITTESGVVTHLVIALDESVDAGKGTMRRAVPISWVDFATEGKVKLSVSSGLVASVAPYHPSDAQVGG